MKYGLFFAYLVVCSFLLQGCWVQEAPVEKKHTLSLIADHLTHEDSLTISHISRKQRLTIDIRVMRPEKILQHVQSLRYNAAVDVVLIEDEELRRQLRDLKAFAPITDKALFSQLERQFSNKHHLWVPVSHDPLVLVTGKDSTGNCTTISSWRTAGKRQPIIAFNAHSEAYRKALRRTKHLGWINMDNSSIRGPERLYALSELVDRSARKDSTAVTRKSDCLFYLVDNKRYVSRMTTVSVYAYARNKKSATLFLQNFLAHAYNVADGRNQLPAKKNVKPNWRIRSLIIR